MVFVLCSFEYFFYDKGNIVKDQPIFSSYSNELALKFIADYDSGRGRVRFPVSP